MHTHAHTVYRIKSDDADRDEKMICCHGIKTEKKYGVLLKVTQTSSQHRCYTHTVIHHMPRKIKEHLPV